MADPLVDDLRLLTTGARYQLERGNTAFMAGHYRTALEYFKRALAADPQSIDARLNFAASLARLGDREHAIQGLREVLLQDPQKAMAHFNLGTLLAQKGDDAEAIRHYRRALEIDPGYASVQFNLANALRRVGRCDEALGPYAAYSRLYPANPEPRYGEAKCLAELGRYREAATKLEEACAALPESALLADALARLLAASPDPSVRDAKRAVDLARQALAAGGTVLRAETLAMALAEAGDFKSAIATQKATVQAAERAGRKDLLARFQTTLALYERSEPCRQPWPRQDAGEPPP
jgi:tetratricopeptide (TPR) repeat protein